MEALYLLVPLSLVVVAIAKYEFIAAADTGHIDHLDTQGARNLRHAD